MLPERQDDVDEINQILKISENIPKYTVSTSFPYLNLQESSCPASVVSGHFIAQKLSHRPTQGALESWRPAMANRLQD